MSEIEKMKRYIERTKLSTETMHKYCLCFGEMDEVWTAAQTDMYAAICLLFEYGRAKGYRAAKAKMKEAI